MNASSNTASSPQLHSVDINQGQWTPWALRDSYFKLLNADEASGRFTLLLKFDKGASPPAHRHVGAVEAYVLEGGFHYLDNPGQRFTSGCYLFEEADSVHQPVSPEGTVMLAIFHGPVQGINRHGEPGGTIDCRWHIDAWNSSLKKAGDR